jgi:hypothetical protein
MTQALYAHTNNTTIKKKSTLFASLQWAHQTLSKFNVFGIMRSNNRKTGT